ncbi:tetratricopeptide repeat protein [Mycobacterium sp. KBS0706]|uniref:tetratricopeptide repeat protein n=1 Tax=Mycobacterium sp. KBS0706 TaxID=2578109 RepID=UPI00163DC999|nr:SEL1-like repeat protein [Mycobacterium sp. KBS0706]
MKIDSMKRLERDAELGDAVAQFNLGIVYGNRSGENDYAGENRRIEAIRWLSRSAQQGLPRAQSRLAEIYVEGPDASRDAVKACAWFLLAAAGQPGARGQDARSGYERAAAQLTATQVAQAHRRASRWKPKIEAEETEAGTPNLATVSQ